MGGGLMQLVAHGKRDVFITGMPQITFFRAVYHRHTPFVVQTVEQTFDVPPTWGQTASASLHRHGDLVSDLFLTITVPEAGVPESDPSRVLGPFDTDDFAHDGTHFLDAHDRPLTEFPTIAETSFGYDETLEDARARFDGHLVYVGRAHSWQYANSIVHRILRTCEIYIGTQRIDTHYGIFYEAWNELSVSEEQREGYGRMIGKLYDEESDVGGRPLDTVAVRGAPGAWSLHRDLYERRGGSDAHMGHLGPVTYYLPLRFWFHSHPGLALPLCAVHPELDVTVRVTLAPWSEDLYLNRRVRVTTGLPDRAFGVRNRFAPVDVSLWADYVYLDDHERLQFVRHTHEYLIPTLQYHPHERAIRANTSVRVPLAPFRHPIRELIWVLHRADAVNPFDFGEFADTEYLRSARVVLGSEDVRDDQHHAASYFRQVNPYYSHTRIPYRHVYCHPFALWPERATQPSGTVNASRLRYAYLALRMNPSSKRPGTDAFVPDTDRSVPQPLGEGVVPDDDDAFQLHLFALGYNVLRIVPNTREVTLVFDRTTTTTATDADEIK